MYSRAYKHATRSTEASVVCSWDIPRYAHVTYTSRGKNMILSLFFILLSLLLSFVFLKLIDGQLRNTAVMESTGGRLLSSPGDLFSRGQESGASTGPAQRQSPWPLGPSPRPGGEVSNSGGGGPSTVAVSAAAAAFSPRVGDRPFPASRSASFYGPETENSPPRLAPINDYHPNSGKHSQPLPCLAN